MPSQRSSRLPCSISGGIGDLRGGIRSTSFTTPPACFLASRIAQLGISGRGLRHVACSARSGVVWCQLARNVSWFTARRVAERALLQDFARAGSYSLHEADSARNDAVRQVDRMTPKLTRTRPQVKVTEFPARSHNRPAYRPFPLASVPGSRLNITGGSLTRPIRVTEKGTAVERLVIVSNKVAIPKKKIQRKRAPAAARRLPSKPPPRNVRILRYHTRKIVHDKITYPSRSISPTRPARVNTSSASRTACSGRLRTTASISPGILAPESQARLSACQ